MPLNIDLHTHSFYSGDGVSSPEEMIATARKKGLHGIALTDHNSCEGIEYLLTCGLMRADGQPVDGFLVIPGVEITTDSGHLLGLGAALPACEFKGMPVLEACLLIHEHGGLAIPAHPYDWFRAGIRESVLRTLPIDAVEVFNSATTLSRCNQQALAYAKERSLPMIAGSDAHHHSAIGTAYTLLDTNDFSLQGVMAQIVKTNARCENYLNLGDNLRKTWNNWLRLRLRQPVRMKSRS